MANDGLVSVIIPTFNRAYCIERAIDSVLGQSYGKVDVIVIDDGSKDDTGQLIERRYGGDSRVRYFYQQNTGISGARNAGLTRVIGDYVALLDSDDDWAPWKLELQIACMRAHPELGMTWTDMIAVAPSGETTHDAYLRHMYHAYRWYPTATDLFRGSEPIATHAPRAAEIAPGRKLYYGDISAEMLMGNLVHTSTVVMTRARAEMIKAFRVDLIKAGEDYEFHLRTCRAGPVGYLDVSAIRYHRGRNDQATADKNKIHLAQNFLRVIEPILKAERNTLRLPRKMQDAVLAEAHAWVGEVRLDMGDAAIARRELFLSLARQPMQLRTARLLLAACLPLAVRERARELYRKARGRVAPPAA
jgi:glycosyltransferase involved in cell wall biosynthesis